MTPPVTPGPKIPPEILGIPPKKDTETPVPEVKTPVIKKPVVTQKSSIESDYAKYNAMKKRLAALIEEENTAGKLAISYPKILPQTGKALLSRVKKMVNAKLSLEAPEFKK